MVISTAARDLPAALKHGTWQAYKSAGCRCDRCCRANKVYVQNWRKYRSNRTEAVSALDDLLGSAHPGARRRAIQNLRDLAKEREELDRYWAGLAEMERLYEEKLRGVRQRVIETLFPGTRERAGVA